MRIDERRKKLGEEGLSKLKRKLEQAQEENDKPFPQELVSKFKVPRIEKVKFINTINAVYRPTTSPSPAHRNEVELYLDQDPSDHPIDLVFSHTSTHFVSISLFITTKGLPGELLPYLQVYLDSFFSLPILRDGQIVDYERVVAQVNSIAVSHGSTLGVDDISEVVVIEMLSEKYRYEEVVKLLGELFTHSIFDPERYCIPESN